jgi:hypothetical protein
MGHDWRLVYFVNYMYIYLVRSSKISDVVTIHSTWPYTIDLDFIYKFDMDADRLWVVIR